MTVPVLGVLVSNKDKKTDGGAMPAKRPKRIGCRNRAFPNNKEKWIAFIGLYDGRPYEILLVSLMMKRESCCQKP